MKLTIGALSASTGVPAGTLRTWERRYGFPGARRTAGGQRVYPVEAVERVTYIERAIAAGHRPAQVVAAPLAVLRALLAREEPRTAEPRGGPPEDPWVALATALDGPALDSALEASLAELGSDAFVFDRVSAFLVALGDAWAGGAVRPFQEHFVTERLLERLTSLWRSRSAANCGPVAVCVTLPGERHSLGLHLAAWAGASAGWRVVFLGPDTPLPDIVECARQVGARAVLVSVSAHAAVAEVAWHLESLRARLPARTEVVAGGAGAPASEHHGDLRAFRSWLLRVEADPSEVRRVLR